MEENFFVPKKGLKIVFGPSGFRNLRGEVAQCEQPFFNESKDFQKYIT